MLYIIYLFGHHRASLNLNLLGSPTSNPYSAVDCYFTEARSLLIPISVTFLETKIY